MQIHSTCSSYENLQKNQYGIKRRIKHNCIRKNQLSISMYIPLDYRQQNFRCCRYEHHDIFYVFWKIGLLNTKISVKINISLPHFNQSSPIIGSWFRFLVAFFLVPHFQLNRTCSTRQFF